jgi:ribonuclease-3
VLGCIVAQHLYSAFPQLAEGELSRLRSNLVREETLVILAQQLDLGNYLLLGEGERKSGGAQRPSILADAMEALIGAVFLDAGFAAAEKVVLGLFVPYLGQVDITTLGKDAKTLLQEYLQGRRLPLPVYALIGTQGEAHAQSFQVECRIPPLKIVTCGTGSSRRSAEQQAALTAYQTIAGKRDT